MKAKLLLAAVLLSLVTFCQAQQNQKWEKWGWLLGAWKGEGSGKPGQGYGSFAFSFDLNNQVIVRRNHTEFPDVQGKPVTAHDDLMIVYYDPAGGAAKAIYFDNEGHVINYTVSFIDKSIVLTSEKTGNTPAFRLTYTPLEKGDVDIVFDMSQDGTTFVTYLEGKSKRAR
jgi:outer membrane lipoprotein-sorting protein